MSPNPQLEKSLPGYKTLTDSMWMWKKREKSSCDDHLQLWTEDRGSEGQDASEDRDRKLKSVSSRIQCCEKSRKSIFITYLEKKTNKIWGSYES